MANIKQQIKRVKTDEKRRQANMIVKSSLKRAMKKVEQHAKENDKEKALVALNLANQKLDKALAKGVHHKNFVARHKSRLAKLVNTL
ncbi:MAG: 30S ribosomal protein S20 [Candidatus Izemoplasmataceae bacterium]|jgi:small subunit ribosomal protein S20|uniref:30S ribosomal protein S20 n=1 Tax=Liberiplasma polymorphum TaxID=3374570 RepID=UPI003771C6EF